MPISLNTGEQVSKSADLTDLRDALHRIEVLGNDSQALRRDNERLESQVEDLRTDRDAWRDQAQRKRLTWRGLFGGGKAE